MQRRLLGAVAAFASAIAAIPGTSSASYLLARNALNVELRVDDRGLARVSYDRASGDHHAVLLWGALNARGSGPKGRDFRIDRSGGAVSGRADPAEPFPSACRTYDGRDAVPFLVAPICKASDGSYWAVQSYQYTGEPMNDGGLVGSPTFNWQLRVSHWTGRMATVEVGSDWTYAHRYHHIFGRVRYQGANPFAGASRANGACISRSCRNISIDTLNSDFGPGWRRASSILVNAPNGQWCFAFVDRGHGTGRSKANLYRVYLSGPGVSPDPLVQFNGPGNTFDPGAQARMTALQQAWAGGTGKCSTVH